MVLVRYHKDRKTQIIKINFRLYSRQTGMSYKGGQKPKSYPKALFFLTWLEDLLFYWTKKI